MTSRDDRKKRLRRRMRQMTGAPQTVKPMTVAGRILAGLNVMRVLEDLTPQLMRDVLCYGPETFVRNDWASAVIWYLPRTINNYHHLSVFGVWTTAAVGATYVVVGERKLAFSAPVFTAEAFNSIIQHNFTTYYGYAAPPESAAHIVYQTPYNVTQRLALRKQLAESITSWMHERHR